MQRRIRVEIVSRNNYWLNAVFVEWEHAYPARRLDKVEDHLVLIDESWLPDLQRIASQVFSTVRLAPENPGRRQWIRRFVPGGNDK
ncbi:MAG: hypothetical protein ACKV2V_10035 [Blastocatellia bacterium]